MDGLLGNIQSEGQRQGNLLGGVFQSPSNVRRQERNSLLKNVLAVSQAQDPFSASAAMGSAEIGLGLGRALGFETEGDRTARIIEQVQNETLQSGLDPNVNPQETFAFIADRFQQLGAPDLAAQALQQRAQFAPEQPEVENVREVELEGGEAALVGTLGNRAVRLTGEGAVPLDEGLAVEEPRGTQRERTVDYYISQGLEPRIANDLANGFIVAKINPLTDQTRLINTTGGPVPDQLPAGVSVPERESVDADQTATLEQGEQPQTAAESPQVEERRGLIDNPLQVGLVPYLQEGIARTAGQFNEDLNFPEITKARTQLRSASQYLISAWASSSRPPVIEQERITRNIPGLGPLESPGRARAQLETLTDQILQQREADLRDIEDENINPTTRRELQQRINAVDRMLRLVDPRALQTGRPTELSEFSPREAESALRSGIESGQVPENASFGAYDFENEGYPIIVDGEPLRDEEGRFLYIRDN